MSLSFIFLFINPELSFAQCCADNDGDGYYNPLALDCKKEKDCDDNDPEIYPGKQGCEDCKDYDNDGYFAYDSENCSLGNDCKDNDPDVNPGAGNCIQCLDNDNDGFFAYDAQACPSGNDCDDSNPLSGPPILWYKDFDNDEYSDGQTLMSCFRPYGYKLAWELTQTSGDCDDNDFQVNPGAEEVCDGKDNNCNEGTDEGCCEISALTVNPTWVYPQNTYGYTETTISISLTKPAPPKGCNVDFTVLPIDFSGGHAHDGNKPKGSITITPDSFPIRQGEIGPKTAKYKSSVVSGTELIRAKVEESGSIAWGEIDIMVPGFTGLSGIFSNYNLKCNIENCDNYKHKDFYNVLPWVKFRFDRIAYSYREKFPTASLLVVTDGSLLRGGLYDYKNTWSSPHRTHRIGTDIDVRSWNIPKRNRIDFQRIVCDNRGYPSLEFPGQSNEHYHLYFFPYKDEYFSYCER